MNATTRAPEGVDLPPAGTWDIDPAHSAATFSARHLMVAKVRGRFAKFSGALHVDEVPERSSAEVEIEATSIDTGEPSRDAHLRSPDFLDVERYPVLRFKTAGLERAAGARFRLTGELTIREAVRPVVLDVTYEGTVTDPWGGTRAAFTATTEIDREEFGITWNQAIEAGGWVVGKKVRVEIEIEAIRKSD
ncbi:MAG: YceI family protein [Acidobacteria bacterium]|nr:YceI family protein [Acidobacteriota bacterium]